MRPFWLLGAASAMLCAPASAQAPDDLIAIVVQFELNRETLEAMAWRDADGALYADRATLTELRLRAPDGDGPVALREIAGLGYHEDAARGAVIISCDARCHAPQTLTLQGPQPISVSRAVGGFFNSDLSALTVDARSSLAGAFELGLFNRHGAGAVSWTANSVSGDVLRLDASWSADFATHRARLTLGDAISRGGATGPPLRFSGVQFATDFSLDPGFVYFPAPTLNGEAATPSTLDLYVDGALRLRERVDAGPFSIVDAPVLSGAGVAQIVVTDALGREQVFAQRFYASPLMLRRGLADYSLSIGAERENYTRESNAYGAGFASGLYRYGVSDTVTAEARLEVGADELAGAGLGVSFAAPRFGQLDVAFAASRRERDGVLARAGWSYAGDRLSLGLEAEAASAHFERRGETGAPPRLRAAASVSADLGAGGAASFVYALRDERDRSDIRTLALNYTRRATRAATFHMNSTYVEDSEPYLTLSFGLSFALRGDVSAGARVESDRGRVSYGASAQHAPDQAGGFGWRVSGDGGAFNRFDGALYHLGATHEAALETSVTDAGNGLRGRWASGIAWIGDEMLVSRPVRESFALVDAGIADLPIHRDRRAAGRTNARGRLMLTGLRAYEANAIGVELDDLPWGVEIVDDEVLVAPAGRSGVIARFARIDSGGEARVVDSSGAPLAAGSMLTRDDGARFPIGAEGRVYLPADAATLTGPNGCVVRRTGADARLVCAAA